MDEQIAGADVETETDSEVLKGQTEVEGDEKLPVLGMLEWMRAEH